MTKIHTTIIFTSKKKRNSILTSKVKTQPRHTILPTKASQHTITVKQIIRENRSHQRGQSTISDSEGETSTSHNPTIHIIPRPQSATNNNKKRKRRFHKGRKTKSRQIQTDLVVNLSNYELTEHEITVLSKGLKFIPTRTRTNKTELLADIKNLGEEYNLRSFFLTKMMISLTILRLT